MGTRSVIAIPQGDGWTGRWCHWDGNPAHQVRELQRIVATFGLEPAIDVLTRRRYAWSVLTGRRGSMRGNDPTIYIRVPGYGVAERHQRGDDGERHWIRHNGPRGGCEYGYVLYPDQIAVLALVEDKWVIVGHTRYDETPTVEQMTTMECGKAFERCSHMAWYHFPEAEGSPYGTLGWLGHEEDVRLAAGHSVMHQGRQVRLQGSGHSAYADGTQWWRNGGERNPRRALHWFGEVLDGGERYDIRIGRECKGSGLILERDLVLVPNAVRGELVIPAGSTIHV